MTYQLHILLKDIYSPEIWRRVIVSADFTFHKLHQVIQKAFGWKDYHLYRFLDRDRSLIDFVHKENSFDIGMPDPEDENEVLPSKKIRLYQVFGQHKSITYIYDFGDHWQHLITLEKTIDNEITNAVLSGGEGACPPEDCGGAHGYEHFKMVMSDPEHEDHEDMAYWAGVKSGSSWNPEVFDVKKYAPKVARIK